MENAKESRQMTGKRQKAYQNHNKCELVKLYFFLKTAQTLIQQIHSEDILKLCIRH